MTLAGINRSPTDTRDTKQNKKKYNKITDNFIIMQNYAKICVLNLRLLPPKIDCFGHSTMAIE